jgi:hypothetical protein
MRRLRHVATIAALVIGIALSPAAFAAHGGGGGGFHGGGMAIGGFHGGGFHGGGFHGGGFHGGFHGGRPLIGYGFGYPYPVDPYYCSQYPDGYNPAAGCYHPYS